MLEPSLISTCAIIAIGLIGVSITIILGLKESAKQYEKEQIKEILQSDNTRKIVDMIVEKTIDIDSIYEYYEKLMSIYKPRRHLFSAFGFLFLSGFLFMLASILGNIDLPTIIDILPFSLIFDGIIIFIFGVYYLFRSIAYIF